MAKNKSEKKVNKKKKKIFYTCRYDKAFKAVFCGEENEPFLNKFLSSIENKEIRVLKQLNNELLPETMDVRRKTVDLYILTNLGFYLLELNNGLHSYTKYRNFAFFASTIAQKTKSGEEYEIDDHHLIDLTYGMKSEDFVEENYQIISKDTGRTYLNCIHVKEINMDKLDEIWYNKDIEKIKKYKYQIMLNRNEEELEELLVIVEGDDFVAEYKEKICKLNNDAEFIAYMSAEEENEKFYKTDMRIAREEGITIGHAFGVNEGKVEFIKQMLANDATIEDISKMSGISVEEINSLLSKS